MIRRTKAERDRRRQHELDELAESYVLQARIEDPPVDPLYWCRDIDRISVHEADLAGECDGLLLFRNGKFHLIYHPNPHRRRFTIAHEVAHYLIEEHYTAIRSGSAEHGCLTGFLSDAEMEREADWFAAGLLMPRFLFAPMCPDPNFKEITEVAREFDVSLTSAVLRVASFTEVRTAVVVTVSGKIKWYFPSEGMVYSGVHSAKVGEPPPRRSKTAEVCHDLKRYPVKPLDGGKCFASQWFKGAHRDPELWEEVLPLPAYGQVMTLLTFYGD